MDDSQKIPKHSKNMTFDMRVSEIEKKIGNTAQETNQHEIEKLSQEISKLNQMIQALQKKITVDSPSTTLESALLQTHASDQTTNNSLTSYQQMTLDNIKQDYFDGEQHNTVLQSKVNQLETSQEHIKEILKQVIDHKTNTAETLALQAEILQQTQQAQQVQQVQQVQQAVIANQNLQNTPDTGLSTDRLSELEKSLQTTIQTEMKKNETNQTWVSGFLACMDFIQNNTQKTTETSTTTTCPSTTTCPPTPICTIPQHVSQTEQPYLNQTPSMMTQTEQSTPSVHQEYKPISAYNLSHQPTTPQEHNISQHHMPISKLNSDVYHPTQTSEQSTSNYTIPVQPIQPMHPSYMMQNTIIPTTQHTEQMQHMKTPTAEIRLTEQLNPNQSSAASLDIANGSEERLAIQVNAFDRAYKTANFDTNRSDTISTDLGSNKQNEYTYDKATNTIYPNKHPHDFLGKSTTQTIDKISPKNAPEYQFTILWKMDTNKKTLQDMQSAYAILKDSEILRNQTSEYCLVQSVYQKMEQAKQVLQSPSYQYSVKILKPTITKIIHLNLHEKKTTNQSTHHMQPEYCLKWGPSYNLSNFSTLIAQNPVLKHASFFKTPDGYILVEGKYSTQMLAKNALSELKIHDVNQAILPEIVPMSDLKQVQALDIQKHLQITPILMPSGQSSHL